jgi:hypothetical protein
MDFRQPQPAHSINGFPITFRPVVLANGKTLWVPRGISRNEDANCWRLYVAHQKGLFTGYVFDAPSPLASLELAYSRLADGLKEGFSQFTVDKRYKSPGKERDPIIDTGFTGVAISRSVRNNKKIVMVTSQQAICGPDGKRKFLAVYVGSVSESKMDEDPIGEERRFRGLLKEAVAARRYHRYLRSKGKSLKRAVYYADVPPDFRNRPVNLLGLDLYAIMDSFMVAPGYRVPKTTGGDPGALAGRLQSAILTKRQPNVYLEGRIVKFFETEFRGRRLYLPRHIGRARDHWRLKVPTADGWVSESVYDSECGDNDLASLYEAWVYLVSLYRACEAPVRRPKPVGNVLLCTCIEDTFIQPQRRFSTKSGESRWTFGVVTNQRVTEAKQVRLTLVHLRYEQLDDTAINEALRRGEAILRYREYRLQNGASLQDAFVEKDMEIPAEFWPVELDCPVYADDLRYYADCTNNAL